MAGTNVWMQVFERRESASLRLLCFPFAGGGAQAFRPWLAQLPSGVELCAAQLPGREMRLRETPFSDARALVRAMLPELMTHTDKPFVLYGHSMGALIAYETARLMQEEHSVSPVRLIVSGRVAPHFALARLPINKLPQDEFIAGLKQLNGTPREILEDNDLISLIGPMLRADLAIHEEYVHGPGPRLACDILAFGGLCDTEAGRAGLNAWAEMTAGRLTVRMLPGDHFFIQTAQSLFLRVLSIELNRLIGGLPGTAALAQSQQCKANG
jgi:medium-chain acyl-[acyl-carrier-protein] hydrolase